MVWVRVDWGRDGLGPSWLKFEWIRAKRKRDWPKKMDRVCALLLATNMAVYKMYETENNTNNYFWISSTPTYCGGTI